MPSPSFGLPPTPGAVPGRVAWAIGRHFPAYRKRVAAGARGRVLEIGFGSGLNLPYYGEAVEEIIGVEPSTSMLALAQPAVAASRHKVTLLAQSADDLALEDGSIDTVVVTWSL